MTTLSESIRDGARQEMRQWRRVRNDAGFAGLAISGVIAGGVLVVGVPLAPAFALGAPLLLKAIEFVAGRKTESANDKSNDPPREDFTTETIVEIPLALDFLDTGGWVAGARDLVESALLAVAYEEAMVTAGERALGAELAGDAEAESARHREARTFGTQAAELDQTLRAKAQDVARLLEENAPDYGPIVVLAAALRQAGNASAEYGSRYLHDLGPAVT